MLVGDNSVGKSSLITSYRKNEFSEAEEPTVLDVYRGTKNINKEKVDVEIHDTSGDENLGTNRNLQYQDADIFMICVACNDHDSLESVQRWRVEIQNVAPEAPIMLILTKSDLLNAVVNPITIAQLKEKDAQEYF